jgi:hypothetical protein
LPGSGAAGVVIWGGAPVVMPRGCRLWMKIVSPLSSVIVQVRLGRSDRRLAAWRLVGRSDRRSAAWRLAGGSSPRRANFLQTGGREFV